MLLVCIENIRKIESDLNRKVTKNIRKKIRAGSRLRIGSWGLRGGYLLSHFRSIIDVVRFNFSVRNGKRWSPHAITTLVSSYESLCGDPPYKVKKRFGKLLGLSR